MARSFSMNTGAAQTGSQPSGRQVLVTGAAGRIGSYFAEHSHNKYKLRLMVLPGEEKAGEIAAFGEVVEAELSDLPRLKELCQGIDTVLHLAGDPSPSATWESLLPNNIVGTYNLMVAAKAAGCRRVIYASSIHAVSGYPADSQVKTDEPVNPGDLYGVSKCFGEALGRYMAEQEGLSVIALRIGSFQPREAAQPEDAVRMIDSFVSDRDLTQLIQKSIDDERLRYAVFQGVSENRFKRLDISDARELVGYAPQDDLTELQPDLKRLNLNEKVIAHNASDAGQEPGIRNEVHS